MGNIMWRVLVSAAALFLFGTDSLAIHGPFGSRNVFTRDMRDFSVADQGMVLGLGKRSGGIGNMYRGAPSLEDAGMLIGMGKRNSFDEEADILMEMHKSQQRTTRRWRIWTKTFSIRSTIPSSASE